LADGIPNRVGTLRGAGNAIVPQVAAEVIKAFMVFEDEK
jgi:DNA (cytosine-5)-methyltransferase 1